jgi:hypothetical protein
MKCFIASIVIGPLMLIGALPAVGQSSSSATALPLATSGDSTANRDAYGQKARDDMRDWQEKLHDFGEKAQAEGHSDAIAAEHRLNEALTKTAAEAHKVQTASAVDWESAKSSYEKASRELADAWDKIRTEDK